jgi:hypothetical protein
MFRKFIGRGFAKWQSVIKMNYKKENAIHYQIIKLERRLKKLAFKIY